MLFFVLSTVEISAIFFGIVRLSKLKLLEYRLLIVLGLSIIFSPILFLMLGQPATYLILVLWSIFFFFQTEKQWKSLLYVLGTTIIAVISDFLVYSTLFILIGSGIYLSNSSLQETIYAVGTAVLITFLCIVVRFLLSKFKVNQLLDKRYLPILILCSISIVGTLFFNIFILQGLGLEFIDIIGFLIISMLYALILLAILFFTIRITIDKIQVENERRQSQQLNEYTGDLEKQYKAIRKNRHDYVNVLTSMTGYVNENDIQGLKDYIENEVLPAEKQVYFDDKQITLLLNLNIPAIKGLLASKLSLAQINGAKVTVEIPMAIDNWNVKNYEMSRILGIILDNAIEESEYCANPEINIGIFSEEIGHVVVIENRCRSDTQHPIHLKQEGFSTKGSNRGLGLSNLAEIVSKSNYLLLETTVNNKFFTQKLTILKG